MSLFQVLILASVQGLTEFLPVSSSGHLVIFQKLFGLKPPVWFDILVHLGTLMAILVYFKERLLFIIEGFIQGRKKERKMVWFLLVGSLPALIAGIFVKPFLEIIFDSTRLVGWCFLITAIFLFITKFVSPKQFNRLSQRLALVIGLFQAVAILPGVSRSGATISAGIWQNLNYETAFEFSFLLAIPAIIGALVLEIPTMIKLSVNDLILGIGGVVIAGVLGYLALLILKRSLMEKRFWSFGFYCLVLAIVVLLFS